MTFFLTIKNFFKKKEQPEKKPTPEQLAAVPNPLVPWEIYGNVHPHSLRCLQGFSEFWSDHIWLPYWSTLSVDEQNALKAKAPTPAWRDWIDMRAEMVEGDREYHKKLGIPFDYRFYIADFMIAYAQAPEEDRL